MKFEIFKFKSVTSTNDVAINLIKEEKKKVGCVYADIQTKGSNHLGRLFSTIYLLDYTSVYLSILRNIDPTPTLNIEKLKEKLKQ